MFIKNDKSFTCINCNNEVINVELNTKKGEVIVYKCKKCGSIVKNIVAKDDNRDEIYKIIKKYSMGV